MDNNFPLCKIVDYLKLHDRFGLHDLGYNDQLSNPQLVYLFQNWEVIDYETYGANKIKYNNPNLRDFDEDLLQKLSEDDWLKILSKNGLMLVHKPEHTTEMALAAVRQNRNALNYVKVTSPEITAEMSRIELVVRMEELSSKL